MLNFFEKHGDTLVTIATIIIAFLGLVALFDQRFDAQEKLINQRFDAQDKYINQRFDAQDRRIDRLEADMNRRFDAQDKRIDKLEADMIRGFAAQDKRLDRLTDDVAELHKLIVGISERVSRNEGEIDVIRQQMQTADKPSPVD